MDISEALGNGVKFAAPLTCIRRRKLKKGPYEVVRRNWEKGKNE